MKSPNVKYLVIAVLVVVFLVYVMRRPCTNKERYSDCPSYSTPAIGNIPARPGQLKVHAAITNAAKYLYTMVKTDAEVRKIWNGKVVVGRSIAARDGPTNGVCFKDRALIVLVTPANGGMFPTLENVRAELGVDSVARARKGIRYRISHMILTALHEKTGNNALLGLRDRIPAY